MNYLALIATMVTLASPNAHGSFAIECVPMTSYGGLAYPWDNKVQLNEFVCKLNFKTILHRYVTPVQASLAIGDLLHEAAHVGQFRENGLVFLDPTRAFEHDAECRALAGMPAALNTLGYKSRFSNRATSLLRQRIETEPLPYGGSCG